LRKNLGFIGDFMSEKLNKRIIEKLENKDLDEDIRKFLKEMLIFELEQFDVSKSHYTKHYQKIISRYSTKITGELE